MRNAAGSTEAIFDVVGYFEAATGQLFHPLSPVRIQELPPGFAGRRLPHALGAPGGP